MKHGKLIVSVPPLTEEQRGRIAARADQYGLEALFFDSVRDAMPHAPEAEIFFGSAPEFTKEAVNLRWVCAPSAGVNQYLTPGALPGVSRLPGTPVPAACCGSAHAALCTASCPFQWPVQSR